VICQCQPVTDCSRLIFIYGKDARAKNHARDRNDVLAILEALAYQNALTVADEAKAKVDVMLIIVGESSPE
jgi:hypothetical protein